MVLGSISMVVNVSGTRGWCPKFATGLKIIIGHSSRSKWVTNLLFCQNDSPIRTSFWQIDSLVTRILFELCQLWYLAQSEILGITLYYAHDSMLKKKILTSNRLSMVEFFKVAHLPLVKRGISKDFHFLVLFWAMTLPVSLLKSFKKLQLLKNIDKKSTFF